MCPLHKVVYIKPVTKFSTPQKLTSLTLPYVLPYLSLPPIPRLRLQHLLESIGASIITTTHLVLRFWIMETPWPSISALLAVWLKTTQPALGVRLVCAMVPRSGICLNYSLPHKEATTSLVCFGRTMAGYGFSEVAETSPTICPSALLLLMTTEPPGH